MPAIRYSDGSLNLQTAYFGELHFVRRVELVVRPGSPPAYANCAGYICNAGARFLDNPRLAKIIAVAITNGDGRDNSAWVPVPDGEYVWCMVVGNDDHRVLVNCYVLVDDEGWPMLTGKPRETTCGPESIKDGHYTSKSEKIFTNYMSHLPGRGKTG